MSAHISPVSTYVKVFLALMVFTVVTVAAAYVDMAWANNAVAMAIALAKAILVILFFMHVRTSSRLIGLVVAGAGLWLVFLFALTFQDYMTRGVFGIVGK
jgi:cytochrome c oxidase subunit IV